MSKTHFGPEGWVKRYWVMGRERMGHGGTRERFLAGPFETEAGCRTVHAELLRSYPGPTCRCTRPTRVSSSPPTSPPLEE